MVPPGTAIVRPRGSGSGAAGGRRWCPDSTRATCWSQAANFLLADRWGRHHERSPEHRYGSPACHEHPSIGQQEVGSTGDDDSRRVRRGRMQSEHLDAGSSDRDISDERYETVAGVEPHQPDETAVGPAPVCPRPPFVPEKVLQDRRFDGDRGCERVGHPQDGHQPREHGDLHDEPDGAHRHERRHALHHATLASSVRTGIGSAAYSARVF
jgi:hypothetical protein